jgi:hypothetical protein
MDRDIYKCNMQQLLLGSDDGSGSRSRNYNDVYDDYGGVENILDVYEASADDLLLDEGMGIETLTPLADPTTSSSSSSLSNDGGGESGGSSTTTGGGEGVRLERAKSLSLAAANAN